MKISPFRIVFIALSALSILAGCMKEQGPLVRAVQNCTTMNVTYAAQAKSIIVAYCATAGCHVNGGAGPGDYNLYDVVKFTIDAGTFQDRTFVKMDMPTAAPLADSLQRKLKCWIEAGALNN